MAKSYRFSIFTAFGVISFAGTSLVSKPVQAAGPITEFPIPTAGATPTSIAGGPDGNVWFSETDVNKIGRVTPAGEITEFPTTFPPLGITEGPDGNLWYAAADLDSLTGSVVGRLSPAGEKTEFPVGLACGIASGPDGNLWFTGCSQLISSIGRITPSGAVTTFPLPLTGQPHRWADSITAGPDGNLWFSEPAAAAIGRITTSGSITEFALPANSFPGPIVAGPDGNLWFAEGGKIGRITPGGKVTEFPLAVTALAPGPEGKLWFADSARGAIGRLSIDGDSVEIAEEYTVPGTSPEVSAIAAAADGNMWFTDAGANAIGRLDIACDPGHLCLGGRFDISAAWAGGGSSGEGRPLSVTANSGAFWFFDPSNVEVFVKILDACGSTGHFNVYVNGLTHLGVTVTVTDVRTGTSRSYANPDGKPFSLIFDGSTFDCP